MYEFSTIDVLAKLVPILMALGSALWTLYTYRASAQKAELKDLDKRIDALHDELNEHKSTGQESRADLRERLVVVEKHLEALPNKEAVHDLALAVTDMRGDVRELGASFKAMAASHQRVENYLLKARP